VEASRLQGYIYLENNQQPDTVTAPRSYQDGVAKLLRILREPGGPVRGTEKTLPGALVHTVPEVFQPREGEPDKAHVDALRALDGRGVALEPVTVVALHGRAFIVDGHHRLEAFKKTARLAARRGKRAPDKIAVRWLTLPSAPPEVQAGAARWTRWLLRIATVATAHNTHLRKPIHAAERSEWAWRLTVADFLANGGRVGARCALPTTWSLSKQEVSAYAGVSKTTVASMRAALKGADEETLGRSWASVRIPRGLAMPDEEAKRAEYEQMIERAAEAMRLTVPSNYRTNRPEVLLDIITAAFPSLEDRLRPEGDEEDEGGREGVF
jgi:hypothetical protein